jgi:hypothetical protein
VHYDTHLDVEDVVEDIPQTKKGSPKIGHFASVGTYDPCVKEVLSLVMKVSMSAAKTW